MDGDKRPPKCPVRSSVILVGYGALGRMSTASSNKEGRKKERKRSAILRSDEGWLLTCEKEGELQSGRAPSKLARMTLLVRFPNSVAFAPCFFLSVSRKQLSLGHFRMSPGRGDAHIRANDFSVTAMSWKRHTL